MNSGTTSSRRSGSVEMGEIGTSEDGARRRSVITQDLVNQIADKVYAMLLMELKIEKERHRLPLRRPFADQGGW